MPIKTEKIIQVLEKGTIEEKLTAFREIKEYMTKCVQEEQVKHESKANELQSISERL